MTKILIILAHPKETSLNKHIADIYHASAEEKGHEVQLIDLYKDTPQGFLTFEKERSKELTPYQKQILRAEEIVLCFPIRRFDAPAILKNFWDINFINGFAYATNKEGKQHGLLTKQKVRIITTAGGPKIISVLNKIIFFFIRGLGRIGFCGMKYKGTTILANAVKSGTKEKQKFFKKILSQIS